MLNDIKRHCAMKEPDITYGFLIPWFGTGVLASAFARIKEKYEACVRD